jgi:hypothetical protein
VTKNAAVEVRYVGNHSWNQFQSTNANPLVTPLLSDFPNLVPAGITPCAASQQVGLGAGTDVGREFCGQGVTRARTNTGYSNYQALQTEFRANNLFKQLTIRTAYTWSKNLDNVSEIFSTFGGGSTNAFAQNPLNPTGEYGISGLNIPHQWTILFNEDLPFFKEQHGFVGHVLGGWSFSANYILASGQGYTPSQAIFASILSQLGLANDYYDFSFNNTFIGIETARPFVGNLKAAPTAVAIMAGDACNILDGGLAPSCALNPTQLLSLNAMAANCLNFALPCATTTVTKDQVRFIVNSLTSQASFGTPFGNASRNIVTDAITNVANVSVVKHFKFTERSSFEFRVTLLNAFNHQNFASVDPILEDAGLHSSGTGFGDVTTTGTSFPGTEGGTRAIKFGGTFRF